MPTYAQLQAEPYWGREITTPEVDWLGDELCRRTGRPRSACGTKGDNRHLGGAHRSQEWIKWSKYCTNRSYTVQSGLTAEQERHLAGIDFVPGEWGSDRNRRLMVEQTGRLVDALVSGRLAGVREVIGTLDGRTVVGVRADGSTFSSDDSHLDHWHLTLDRRKCRDKQLMERIVAVALGEDDDMDAKQFLAILKDPAVAREMRALPWQYVGGGIPKGVSTLGVLNEIVLTGRATAARVGADLVDERQLAADLAPALLAVLTPEAIAAAIPDTLAGQVVDVLAARLSADKRPTVVTAETD
ncbi:hypothetical protein GA0074692_6783 [Micromonospora pallida]|uniref:Uncharacterized protein n=1 Tax=Micromonospora pallida TaxID=145854 RepID=A0A1C6TN32_9ACTN|nr:hypothetical protein [Micromonospora pallida]SCL43144.1 hypothetical protein GA0074692_6732 [Micromonospora pallida]SCL43242.1 hypothetical protein GA0074692_6783 [Micromonospora pallida]